MEVTLEGSSAPGLGIASILTGLLVIPIAVVPRRAMLRPRAYAGSQLPLAA